MVTKLYCQVNTSLNWNNKKNDNKCWSKIKKIIVVSKYTDLCLTMLLAIIHSAVKK